MTAVVLTFQAHQPHRLARLCFRDVGRGRACFDAERERREIEQLAARCYAPLNAHLAAAIDGTRHRFRCALAVTGTLLAQLERFAPEVVAGFVRLARTGAVEFVCETDAHSLAFRGDPGELRAQVEAHRRRLWQLSGVVPRTFRHAGPPPDGALARTLDALGFECLLVADGAGLLAGRSPRRVYRVEGCRRLRLLVAEGPAARGDARGADVVCISPAAEALAAHDGATAVEALLGRVLADPGLAFATPLEAARRHAPSEQLDLERKPAERDAWLENELQREAHRRLYALLPAVRAHADPELLADWRRLSDAAHLGAMRIPDHDAGGVPPHAAGAPPATPHDSFITFMHALDDLQARLATAPRTRGTSRTPGTTSRTRATKRARATSRRKPATSVRKTMRTGR
jgi:alpha-amylase